MKYRQTQNGKCKSKIFFFSLIANYCCNWLKESRFVRLLNRFKRFAKKQKRMPHRINKSEIGEAMTYTQMPLTIVLKCKFIFFCFCSNEWNSFSSYYCSIRATFAVDIRDTMTKLSIQIEVQVELVRYLEPSNLFYATHTPFAFGKFIGYLVDCVGYKALTPSILHEIISISLFFFGIFFFSSSSLFAYELGICFFFQLKRTIIV